MFPLRESKGVERVRWLSIRLKVSLIPNLDFSLTIDLLDVIWANQFVFWSLAYLTLALAAICLSLVTNSGVIVIMGLLFYPMYVLCIATVWSFTGTYFEDIVGFSAVVL